MLEVGRETIVTSRYKKMVCREDLSWKAQIFLSFFIYKNPHSLWQVFAESY
jgi:hypothetical protein